MSDLIGRTLGKYQIEEKLGQGGMAEVYKAYQPGLDRYVAVKVMHSYLASDPEFRARFQREAKHIASLRHPNIIQIHDFETSDDLAYMVMECIEGPNLHAYLNKQGKLSLAESLHIILEIGDALAYAHGRDTLHRDIKPENVMVDDNGRFILTDFGLAKLVKGSSITTQGSIVGTPNYMAPEVGQGHSGDHRADIYSLGVLMYWLITGQVPYTAETAIGIIYKHINHPLPTPTDSVPDLPRSLEKIMHKALAKKPGDRYQTTREMIEVIRAAIRPLSLDQLGEIPGHKTIIHNVPQASSLITTSIPLPDSPYRGLFAFREENADFFFGREAYIEQLREAVDEKAFIALIGSSGSGKSSLVFAGLIPFLRQTHDWQIVEFRPGERPFQALAAPLVWLLDIDISETSHLVETRRLGEALYTDPELISDVLERLRKKYPDTPHRLFVIDQFEEVFTLCTDIEQRIAYLDMLLDISKTYDDISLIITLRADFLSQALSYRPFADRLQTGALILGPMTREELESAIRKPADKQGVSFEGGLVERILDDIGQEPGNLPLLQFALTQLWREQKKGPLSHNAYEDIGRAEGALAHYADNVYGQLSGAEKLQARQILLQMVKPGMGTEDTRRLATRYELGDENWGLVQKLANARLIVTGRDSEGQETVEVIHEALIRGWQQIREWLNEDREFLLWRQRLRAALTQWEASQRDDSALLRGALLAEAEAWCEERNQDLNRVEHDFVTSSVALREKENIQREARRQRELETAKRLAETESQRAAEQEKAAQQLRRRGYVQTGLLVIAALLAIATFFLNRELQNSLNVAEAGRIEAEMERDRADQQVQVTSSNQLASQSLFNLGSAIDLALLLGVEAYATDDNFNSRNSLYQAIVASDYINNFLSGHTGSIENVTYSPDGRLLASAGSDGQIILWDTAVNQQKDILNGHTGTVHDITFDPNGRYLVSVGADSKVIMWDMLAPASDGALLSRHTASVWSVAVSPDGSTIASGDASGRIILWDAATQEQISDILSAPIGRIVNVLAFSPDGSQLAAGISDNTILVWDLATSELIADPFVGHNGEVLALTYSPDGRTLVSGSCGTFELQILGNRCSNGAVIFWNMRNLGRGITRPTQQPAFVHSLAYSADGALLAIGSGNGVIQIWDAFQQRPLPSVTRDLPPPPLQGHSSKVLGLSFAPDNRTIASGGEDHKIIVWDIAAYRQQYAADVNHVEAVNAVAFLPNGQQAVTIGTDQLIIFWDMVEMPNGTPRLYPNGEAIRGHNGWIQAVAINSKGTHMVTGSADTTLLLWDMQLRQPIGDPFIGHGGRINSVVFHPDDDIIISADNRGSLIVWDVATHQPINQPDLGVTQINQIAISPNGEWLAVATNSPEVILWHIRDEQKEVLTGFEGNVLSVAFSPDGRYLTGGDSNSNIRVWDWGNRDLVYRLSRQNGSINGLVFTPDGETLVSSSGDNTIVLWDMANGTHIIDPLTGHLALITGIAMNSNGRYLASVSADRTVRMWEIQPADWPRRACHIANRNLTAEEWSLYFNDAPYYEICHLRSH